MKRQLILLVIAALCFAQVNAQPPYKKSPFFPPVKLLLPDKTSWTKDKLKKQPVMMFVFSPNCDHCKMETEDILKHIDEFKDKQIVMVTTMPYDSMMGFWKHYELGKYKNIVVGQDTQYLLAPFYDMKSYPFFAFYNKKKNLITAFQGSMPVTAMIDALNQD